MTIPCSKGTFVDEFGRKDVLNKRYNHVQYKYQHHIVNDIASSIEKALRKPCISTNKNRINNQVIGDNNVIIPHRENMMKRLNMIKTNYARMKVYLEQKLVLEQQLCDKSELNSSDSCQVNDIQNQDNLSCCAICLEEMHRESSMKPIVTLQCSHIYHLHCINAWTKYNSCCPIDRITIDQDANIL